MRGKWSAVIALCVVFVTGAAFAEAPAKTAISGVAVDAAGEPVKGASVSLYMLTADMATMRYECQLLAELMSDAEGKFSYREDVPDVKGWGIYCCLVQKEGLACGWSSLQGGSQANWTITLGEPSTLGGLVKDGQGTPIADATVRLVMLAIPGSEERVMIGTKPVKVFEKQTDADGRFTYENLPADATVEFQVEKDGKGMLHTLDTSLNPRSGLSYKAGQSDIELTMADACRVIAKVLAQEGQKPVAGVGVMVRDAKLPVNFFYQPVASAEDGTVTFEGLSPGDYILTATDDDWIAAPVTVTAAADATAEATIELTKGGSVEITVVEESSKEPVAGVHVNLRNDETQQYQQMNTDEKGVGQKQVMAGTYQVSVYKQGYRSMQQGGTVTVENGKTATLTVELLDQPKIKGMVTDADGKPVEGAKVRVYPGSGLSRDGVQSDEKGKFTLPWDPGQNDWAEGEFYLHATHEDKNLAGVVQIAEDAKEATVKLEKGVTVKGKVVNAESDPIIGAKARMNFHGSRFSSTMGQGVQTDGKGEYTFTALAVTQKYSVRISEAKGYGTGRKEIAADGDLSQTLEDIVLPVADQKVTGQVVDVDGKPLAGVNLHCYGNGDSGQPNINAKTDGDGKFVLENVCVGQINISANYRSGTEYMHGNVGTEGGAEDVKIIVAPQGSGSQRFVPKKAASLVGKPLGDLTDCGLEIPADAGRVLVFAWDMNQRPSRHFIKQLAAQGTLLKEKAVTVLLVQAAPAEKVKLDSWLEKNGITWPCGIMTENADDTKFKLGIQGLPWLILTDAEHKVVAEGFKVDELDSQLK